jgi:acetyl-CoA synthetase
MSERSGPVASSADGRGLAVARAVLKVLTLLAEHPDGVRASDVAGSVVQVLTLLAEHPGGVRARDVAETVGKSTSTAYYLLASLCDEGLAARDGASGRYRLRRDACPVVPRIGDRGVDDLEPAVDALFLRTRKNSYLGRAEPGGLGVRIVAARGRDAVPKIRGLGTRIVGEMHALAMGKIALSLQPDHVRLRYLERGLRRFTDATITSSHALLRELDEVRAAGVAIERDEFQPDFCCVAAPMLDLHGRFVATLGLSTTTQAFDTERDRLVTAVLDAAAMSQPLHNTYEILRREGLAA